MKVAASEKCGFSKTLIPVKSSKFPTPLSCRLRVISWSLAILCSSAFYLGPILLMLPAVLLKYHPSMAFLVVVVDLFLTLSPVYEWRRFRTFFQMWYELFNLRTNMKENLSDTFAFRNELAIVAMHPHAIIPLHGFLWCAFCEQFLPRFYGVGAATDISLRAPILRQILGFLSVGSARKAVLLKSLQVDGKNLFILPGGVAEIFLSRRHSHLDVDGKGNHVQTIKAKRYGLMKLSLETGAAIIPAYTFGANDLFDQLTPVNRGKRANTCTGKKHLALLGYISERIESLSRRIQGGVTLFWGKGFLPIPYTPQITMVFGDPIYPMPGTERSELNITGQKHTCKKVPNPSHEQIVELMGRYTEALYCLFEQYKEEAGYPRDELEII